MDRDSDELLFEQYRRGDLGAFRTLVERHHDDLLRFLTRLTGDAAGAEDVFQETFLQVHHAADTFDETRKLRPWLFTIAANKARDYLRRKARRRTLDLSAPLESNGDGGGGLFIDLLEVRVPGPDARMSESETNEKVQHALDRLPYALREILLLAYFQRLSYNLIADELEIPIGTVKSRLHSAVAAFAKQWKLQNPESNNLHES
ncbi:MAG: RNA polymerase sigma factor [Phycisphaerales bacterium]